jgi:saccharopine dehydrogenase-like NADP-dependent oxidoreductase
VDELDKKLKLNPGETDLIAMQHVFRIQPADPIKKPFTRKSSLIMIGEKNGHSAMSLTVGLPTAIGAQLVLDGKITHKGVVIPTHKEIY